NDAVEVEDDGGDRGRARSHGADYRRWRLPDSGCGRTAPGARQRHRSTTPETSALRRVQRRWLLQPAGAGTARISAGAARPDSRHRRRRSGRRGHGEHRQLLFEVSTGAVGADGRPGTGHESLEVSTTVPTAVLEEGHRTRTPDL